MKDLLGAVENEVLRDRGVDPATTDSDPRIVVVVRPISDPKKIFDNRVDISIEVDGRTLNDPAWGFDCEQCTDGNLYNKVAITLHSVVTRLKKEIGGQASTGDGGSGAVDDPPQNEHPPQSKNGEAVKPGPLVWAGGAVALVGLGGIVVGVPLVLRDDRIDGGLTSDRRELVETRTPGWASIGVGAAALIGGGAMLAVGLARWNRAKEARASETTTAIVTPWVGSDQIGLGIHGRF